jgi:hypothetical protein
MSFNVMRLSASYDMVIVWFFASVCEIKLPAESYAKDQVPMSGSTISVFRPSESY